MANEVKNIENYVKRVYAVDLFVNSLPNDNQN